MEGFFVKIFIWYFGFGLNVSSPLKTDFQKCTECHKDLLSQTVVHAPADGCDNCHKAIGAEHPVKNVKGFALTDNLPQLCYTCHGDIQEKIGKSSMVHLAINEKKSCTVCHSPHSSAQKKLLLAEDKALCFTCHNKTMGKDGKTIANIKLLVEKSKVVHGAIESGCLTCHQPHSSTNRSLLTAAFPRGAYSVAKADSFSICFTCHESKLIEEAVTTTATSFRNGDKNLHNLHINGVKGRSCNNCHNVHASNNEHLIADKVKFGKWDMPLRYVVQEGGGSCSPGCHSEKKYKR